MKKFITLFTVIFVAVLCFEVDTGNAASTTWLARSWLTKGEGWAERGIVRVSGDDAGSLLFEVTYDPATDTHYIVRLAIRAELNMSKFNIEAWDFSQNTDFSSNPIPVPKVAPTLSRPFRISVPSFETSNLRVYGYQMSINSASSGTMRLQGELLDNGIDFDLENVLWQQGTPEPDDPDNESGCNSVFGLSALLLLTFGIIKRYII